jgi:hypothetical protein
VSFGATEFELNLSRTVFKFINGSRLKVVVLTFDVCSTRNRGVSKSQKTEFVLRV